VSRKSQRDIAQRLAQEAARRARAAETKSTELRPTKRRQDKVIAGIPSAAWLLIREHRPELIDELADCRTFEAVAALFAAQPFLQGYRPLRPGESATA
jgi:hypothetical protein